MKNKILNTIKLTLFLLAVGVILGISIKGLPGSPTETDLNTPHWMQNGPFELSPERGRFTLLYSFVENHSLIFSIPLARFATPDLGYKNGNYVSLFAPAVSFLAIPGYIIGRNFGASQFGTFATISFFALLNILLIILISDQLKTRRVYSYLGALCFIFATPAFAYGVSLYQHHVSTFFILLSIYSLYKWDNWKSLAVIWFSFITAFAVDYPNIFIMFPFMFVVLFKVINFENISGFFAIKFRPLYILPILAVILPILFLGWFNKNSYDNYFQMSGTVKSVGELDADGKPVNRRRPAPENVGEFVKQSASASSDLSTFFETRGTLNGFYILILSPDRGIITFAPIILLGIIGIYLFYKENLKYLGLLVSIMFFNILIYAMWGDVWGGWAFGPRYLVATYAISGIFIAKALSIFNKNILFMIAFIVLFGHSAYLNTAGAITSNANPPKVEVLALEKVSGVQERYSYDRNIEHVNNDRIKTFVYNTFLKDKMNGKQFFNYVYGAILIVFLSVLLPSYFKGKKYE